MPPCSPLLLNQSNHERNTLQETPDEAGAAVALELGQVSYRLNNKASITTA